MTEQARPLRWIVPVAYAVSANLLFAIPLAAGSGDANGSGPLGWAETASFVALCVLFVANILECAIITARDAPGLRAFSRRTMLMMKLGLIPFFLFGGLIMLFLMVLSIHPVLAVAGWISLPIAAAFGWLIMMGGSAWAITYALELRRAGFISAGECAAHVVLQLFFFADVVDAVVLFARGRKRERLFTGGAGPCA